MNNNDEITLYTWNPTWVKGKLAFDVSENGHYLFTIEGSDAITFIRTRDSVFDNTDSVEQYDAIMQRVLVLFDVLGGMAR
jgi:ABC-type proline/glycine betaine transport system substrate-binding protein